MRGCVTDLGQNGVHIPQPRADQGVTKNILVPFLRREVLFIKFLDPLPDIELRQLLVLLAFTVITEFQVGKLADPAITTVQATSLKVSADLVMIIFGSQHGLYVYMVQQVLFRNFTDHVKGTLHNRSRTLPVFEHAVLVILLRRTVEADGEGEMIPYKEFHHLPCQQGGIGRYVEYDLLRRYMVFLPRKREYIFHQRFQQ